MNSSNNTEGNSHAGARFGKHLSREEIQRLREGKAGREGLDDFDRDALEGWEKASGGIELMQVTDRKYLPKSRWMYYIGGALAVVLVAVWFLLPQQQQAKPQQARAAKTTVDKSDVVIAQDIQQLEELSEDLQIKPQQVVSNFREKQEEQEQKAVAAPSGPLEEEPVILPPKEIPVYSSKPKVTIGKETAKEVYLVGFKLIDYRAYRSRPAIPTEQMTLSGTPADQEESEIRHDDPAWRTIDIPYHDYLRQTMEQFKAGKFKQTLSRSNSILESYPDDINALFYGGLCYYNLNQMDLAINAFQQVISNQFNNFDEEALWYLANAYDLKNDKAKARELFQAIAGQKGYYAKQAEKMLKK